MLRRHFGDPGRAHAVRPYTETRLSESLSPIEDLRGRGLACAQSPSAMKWKRSRDAVAAAPGDGDQINAAPSLDFLRTPPSNRLEKLRGDLEPHWSLRIADQWRIIFLWEGSDASEVRIMDYHD